MKRVLALLLTLLLWCSQASWAVTSKQYVAPETSFFFGDSAQTPTATITFSALATVTGRISAQLDRGAGSHAAWYEWHCTMSLTGTNVVGAAIEWYIAMSDGTNIDGQVGTADAALAIDKRNNLKPIGVTIVDQTTTNTNMTASGLVYLTSRYLSLGVWNGSALPFQTSTSAHKCVFIPMPPEQQ